MPTILVADDNSNIQKMVTNALKDKGIEVIGVANGDAAIKKLEILNPDMVLADVFMPVKDGYELCEWIKARERLAAVPVFLLVGAFDPLDEQKVQAVKADGVLKKPFVPPDHLIGAVSAMLERTAKTRAAAEMQSAHDQFSSLAPPAEDTQKLPEPEIVLTEGAEPAAVEPEPEPEMDVYASRPARLSFDEGDAPMGLDALEEEAAEGEESAFRPSSMEGIEVASGGGVIEESRQPSPDEPPIKVDFTGEKLELVTSDDAEGMARFTHMSASAPEVAPAPTPEAPPPIEMAIPTIPEVRLPEAEPPAELPSFSWPEPAAAEPPAPEPAAEAAPMAVAPPAAAEPEARPKPMPLSAAQQQVLVDEIVERVVSQLQPQIAHRIVSELGKGLETLQPQLLDRITKEVIRPLAEDMFKKKTE